MYFNRELIEKFRALHLSHFGVEISHDVAELQLKELAELIRISFPRREIE